ncbi:MAG: hypothetical protein ACR2QU_02625 [Gammaproteobacteria bacterium]
MTTDTTPTADTQNAKKRPGYRLRKELTIFSIMVAIGLVVLPFAVFKTGEILLGEYSSEGQGIGHLYGDILRGLSAGDWTAWLLVLGPWLGIMLLRTLWWPLVHTKWIGKRRHQDQSASG